MPFLCFRPKNINQELKCFSFFPCLATLMLYILLEGTSVNAAMQGKIGDSSPSALYGEGQTSASDGNPENSPGSPDSSHQAAASISGSPWPGVIDHLLQRPLPDETAQPGKAEIHINYPSFGNRNIDADIRGWVNGVAEAFQSHLDLDSITSTDTDENLEAAIDSLTSGEAPADEDGKPAFELWGNYSVSRPSPASVSITFELWNYTGAPHANMDVITLNYSLLNGQRLSFVDLFEKTDLALELMSKWSRKELANRLGSSRRSQMLNDGTEPIIENFSSLTLTPEGICINFQPYQVAPWDAGAQKVIMPLEELMPSSPLLALWGK